VPRTVDRGGPAAPPLGAALADLALLAQFAAPHRRARRPRWKARLRAAVPEAYERSTYGLVAALSLAPALLAVAPDRRAGVGRARRRGARAAGGVLVGVGGLRGERAEHEPVRPPPVCG
jgi:hypothetical protein